MLFPRRSFFQLLRRFTSDELEQETLDDFYQKKALCVYFQKTFWDFFIKFGPYAGWSLWYCFRVRRTIQEVLTEFRSAKIPKEYIFDLFPPMRPREFSIASSIKVSPPCLNTSWSIRLASRVRTAPSAPEYIYVLQSLNIEQSWGYQGEECVRHSWQPCTLVYWTVLS